MLQGFNEKSDFQGVVHKKTIFRGELSKNGGLGQFADLREAW